jgi:hypothetical protein
MKEMARQVSVLTEYLGSQQDLAVLQKALPECAKNHHQEAQLALDLAEKRRVDLAEAAFVLGERLYAEKPSCLSARILDYWEHR